uniref:Zinc finger protein 665-like n=1 Tax=Stegastes partitus TaxID=144197 RepID=A0A3B4ZW05_9TELE
FNADELNSLNVAPVGLISSDSCKRSSRVKTCSVCGEIFTRSADLTSHMRCHADQSPYRCLHCGKDFDNCEDRETHQEGECRNQRPHAEHAQESSLSSTNRRNLENSAVSRAAAHIQTVKDVTADSPLTCQESNHFIINACDFQSAPQNSSNSADDSPNESHIINKHRERQPSVCSCCGKQFSTKDCLRAHMVRHTGGYPCPVCGKKFYQKTYLKWHLYKHTGQEPYLCDTCGKGWPSAAQLKLHMVQHTEERPFKCEDCGACYKRGSHLTKHMMVHTGERPFTCPRCGKTFTRKSRLREHREKTETSICPALSMNTTLRDSQLKSLGPFWPSLVLLKLRLLSLGFRHKEFSVI